MYIITNFKIFKNFKICPNNVLNIFGSVIIIKAFQFKLITFKFVANALIRCTTLLGSNCEEENVYIELMLELIVYVDQKYVTKCNCIIPP